MSDYLLKLLETLLILVININVTSCFQNNLDFEIDITKNILNSENIIIDLSKKLNLKNNYYIKILSYEEEYELYSSQNPIKKLNPGDYFSVEEKLILNVNLKRAIKLGHKFIGKIEYLLISKKHNLNNNNIKNIIYIKINNNIINRKLNQINNEDLFEDTDSTNESEKNNNNNNDISDEIWSNEIDKIEEEEEKFSDDITNTSYCSIEDILNNTCNDSIIDLDNINDIKNYLLEQKKQVIGDDENFYRKLKAGNIIIQFATLEEQQKANDNEVSSIDIGNCEIKLRTQIGISLNKSLIVYKVDIKTSDLSSTYVQYEIYNPDDMNQLNLSICEQITIETPVNIGNTMVDIYNSLSESGYNLFDSNDSFYQDICSVYTTSDNTDILLSDRKEDIYRKTEGLTLCQNGCTIESYNTYSKKAKCNCDTTKMETTLSNLDIDKLFDKKEIYSSFYDTLSNSNFRVLKCYKSVFSSNFFYNVGGIFMTLIGVVFLMFNFLAFVLHESNIENIIKKIMILEEDKNIIPNTKINSVENLDIKKDNNENNNYNETSKPNKEEKKKKNKKNKKKKKKGVEDSQYPPKKRKKNKYIENGKIEAGSFKNDTVNSNNLVNNKNKTKNNIEIYPNTNTIDKTKIKTEKQNINSKGELQDTKDDKDK